MYNTLKSVVKTILPERFIIRNEDRFRKLLEPFYSGNTHYCNICDTSLRKFAKLHFGDEICPVCGSLPRTRRLYKLLSAEFLKADFAILDFSPSRALYRKLQKRKDLKYFATDFEDEFLSDYRFDITNIEQPDEKFDVIMCYHILEHVPDDEKAISELYRVLKQNGTLLVQTPFKDGEIYEDFSVTKPEDRLKHFGQIDHVRIYSASGLQKRLQKAGFETEIRQFDADFYYGLADNEKIIICKKKLR
ncbi:class I SAM-dependent methyltransferase [Chryseobacterium taklimakanense]|uniref:class I SAM-dependent methyltransferase n=1 Tax=Chryseobacterium taklimakanense TaxID=536441 RepID=UPI001EF58241|nr:class I SAM-dependent methyltransferase [Chryseobacterium taklimakanense]MCG7281106.1 class I SAM-dependent methyltransferase [Chryseobacterium taklimakanense]